MWFQVTSDYQAGLCSSKGSCFPPAASLVTPEEPRCGSSCKPAVASTPVSFLSELVNGGETLLNPSSGRYGMPRHGCGLQLGTFKCLSACELTSCCSRAKTGPRPCFRMFLSYSVFMRKTWRLLKGQLLFFNYLKLYSASVSTSHSVTEGLEHQTSQRGNGTSLLLKYIATQSLSRNLSSPGGMEIIMQDRAQNKAQCSLSVGSTPW